MHEGNPIVSNFDARQYMHLYPDVAGSDYSPWEHYQNIGRLIGRTAPMKQHSPENDVCSQKDPVVSVVCITFNHEKYIAETIKGFLAQETSFKFEVIIANDASTDRTGEIVHDLAQSTSNIEFVIINRASNMGVQCNFLDALSRARGKYVAICEGDDYWINNLKLQKQKDLLDNSPSAAICFHPVQIIYESGEEQSQFPEKGFFNFSIKELARANFIQTNSVMYRWGFRGPLVWEIPSKALPTDWILHLYHAEQGGIVFIDEIMAVYRKHDAGIWSSAADNRIHRIRHGIAEIEMFKDLMGHFGGYFDDRFLASQDELSVSLFSIGLVEGRLSLIYRLYTEHPEVFCRLMRRLGVSIDLSVSHTSDDLREIITELLSVDVIVTCYNQADTIGEALRSVIAQKGLMALNIIIGDDDSTDGTRQVIEESIAGLADVSLLARQDNIGMLANLKRCISMCRSNFVAICEGDDVWLSRQKLIRQICTMMIRPDVAMCFNWSLLEYTHDGRVVPHPEQMMLQKDTLNFDDLIEFPYTANFSACCYRAESLRLVPADYFRNYGAADWLFNLYIARTGDVAFSRELLSCYRIHEKGQWSGLSSNARKQVSRDLKRKYEELFGHVEMSVSIDLMPEESELSGCGLYFGLDIFDARFDHELGGPALFLSGWLASVSDIKRSFRLTSGNSSIVVPLNFPRPDVYEHFLSQGILVESSCCGFGLKVPIAADKVFWIDAISDIDVKSFLRIEVMSA